MTDTEITEIDRMAYIDGQLDDPRRLDVETSLSTDPAGAAGMMADLAHRTALRMSLGGPTPRPSPALEDLIAATQPRPRWRASRWAALAATLAAAALLSVGGDAWRLASRVGGPNYLDDAVQSRQASLVRTSMASRPSVPWMKPNDISTAIRIRLPVMPAEWRLVDVQVFPSDEGPSAQLLIDPGDGRQVTLFSSRINGAATRQPVVVDRLGETMAFWEVNGQSFVLMGEQSRADLHEMAVDLADNHLL
jgi:anti-sigma factor RsiW